MQSLLASQTRSARVRIVVRMQGVAAKECGDLFISVPLRTLQEDDLMFIETGRQILRGSR